MPRGIKLVIFSFIIGINVVNALCPERCTCVKAMVSCTNLGLKSIPRGIPVSTVQLDLSNNQGLHLEKHSLVNFTRLQTLTLINCLMTNPFILPINLISVDLTLNRFTIETLKQLFANAPELLAEIKVDNNDIVFQDGFSVFPNSTKTLSVSWNRVDKINNGDLVGLRNLKKLTAISCGLAQIEQGAFDPLKGLRQLHLASNKLERLPSRLFQGNDKIMHIDMQRNKLRSIPDLRRITQLNVLDLSWNEIKNASGLNVPTVFELILSKNQIEHFSFMKTRLLKLDLSSNKIRRLPDSAFPNATGFKELFLQNNKIVEVSTGAFKGVTLISELHLQRNKIKSLPRGIFKGVAIGNLFLYGNHISNMDGALDGMTKAPKRLVLFSMLTTLNGNDFEGMEKDSNILIGCGKLRNITNTKQISAKIKCVPFPDLYIRSHGRSLIRDGFFCPYSYEYSQYLCYPCLTGYHGNGPGVITGNGGCFRCPAGSFYQDELAATSCKRCPPGQFVPHKRAPGKSLLDCLTCPKGTNTNSSAGYRACPCLDGYSRVDRFEGCKKCTTEGFSCKRDYPTLKEGYWMEWSSKQRTPTNQSCQESFKEFMANLDTKTDNYNRKTSKFLCLISTPHKCPIRGSCLGGLNAKCQDGYRGVLCAVCRKGYSQHLNKCIKCPKPFVAALQFVGYITLFLIVCLLLSWADKFTSDNTKQQRNWLQEPLIAKELRSSTKEKRTFADIILSSLKILIGFYQVLSYVIDAFSYIPWPRSLKTAIGIFEYLELKVLRLPSLRCIKTSWHLNAVNEFWFSLVAAAVIPIVIAVYFFIKAGIIHCMSKSKDEFLERCKTTAKNCLRSAALFFFVTYSLLSRSIVRVLPISCQKLCITKAGGLCQEDVSYLRSDYSVKCLDTSMEHKTAMYTAYGALILPFGFPILLLVVLWRLKLNGRTLGASEESMDWIVESSDDDESWSINQEPSMRECHKTEGRYLNFRNLWMFKCR